MFGTLIDYWYYTNDTTYNQIVIDGIQSQIGAKKNFVGPALVPRRTRAPRANAPP